MISALLFLSAAINAEPEHGALADKAQIIYIQNNDLLLSDILDVGTLPSNLQEKAREMVVARIASESSPVYYKKSALFSRARSLLPALSAHLYDENGLIQIRSLQKDARVFEAVVPSTSAKDDHAVSIGQKVIIRLAWGAVKIEQLADALQPANPGQRFFARTPSNEVIVVECCNDD
ncbi:hypothetical protein ACFOWX_01385 [Sphingorhabdus arenilitoris]|uniref:Flagella basal body P-ring formation protein FlgA C-terminal domain-containing protein n=1 Tax=Sphingorhabdus arenilitoris TaxID=1490041 RepID=A0ABV8RCY8_9SPHN